MLNHNLYSVILTDGELIGRIQLLNEELSRLEETLEHLFKVGASAVFEIEETLERFVVVHNEKKFLVSELEELGLSGYNTR
ncbi:hypothetical protein VCHA54P489_450003 [Vibrio chagasii]|nr:hypothetical protein VCHA54P489_450003 [Vibrio chagasii]CAH7314126.1 hypothetical protein VCHA49P380_440002 [Vibrio chagasii]CAH7330852.1 hypothetical protein VCHA37P202_470002 [Vibrio chagasii]